MKKIINVSIIVEEQEIHPGNAKTPIPCSTVEVWSDGRLIEGQDVGIASAFYVGKVRDTSFVLVSPCPWDLKE